MMQHGYIVYLIVLSIGFDTIGRQRQSWFIITTQQMQSRYPMLWHTIIICHFWLICSSYLSLLSTTLFRSRLLNFGRRRRRRRIHQELQESCLLPFHLCFTDQNRLGQITSLHPPHFFYSFLSRVQPRCFEWTRNISYLASPLPVFL